MYKMLRSGSSTPAFRSTRRILVVRAYERDLPIFVPGWEDSTLGNIFAAHVINGDIANVTGSQRIEYMIGWRTGTVASRRRVDRLLQIGGGIAGDFPICVVPMLRQDLLMQDIPRWLFLSDQRLDDELWLVLGRGSEREKITWASCRRTREVHHQSDAASSHRWCSRAYSANRRGRL